MSFFRSRFLSVDNLIVFQLNAIYGSCWCNAPAAAVV